MGNNLYSNLVNFYNINDENFKEFMSEIYKEMLITHRDVQYVKEHLTEEIVKILDKYLVDGKFNINIEEKVNEFLENNQEIKDITAKLIINTNKIEDVNTKLKTNTSNIENINSQLDTIETQKADLNIVVDKMEEIYVAPFFDSDSSTKNYLYKSYDGINFEKLNNIPTLRDGDIIYYKEKFYCLATQTTNPYNDFRIFVSDDLITWNEKIVNIGLRSETNQKVYAPEWFIDDNGEMYITISIQVGNMTDSINSSSYDDFRPYLIKVNDLEKFIFGEVKKINLTEHNRIDPHIYKSGNKYFLYIKKERNQDGYVDGQIEIWSSNDLTNWIKETNAISSLSSYKFEAPCIEKINDTYFLYVDNYGGDFGSYMYYCTSNDLINWSNPQPIKVDNSTRHASIRKIKDTKAIKIINNINKDNDNVKILCRNTTNYQNKYIEIFNLKMKDNYKSIQLNFKIVDIQNSFFNFDIDLSIKRGNNTIAPIFIITENLIGTDNINRLKLIVKSDNTISLCYNVATLESATPCCIFNSVSGFAYDIQFTNEVFNVLPSGTSYSPSYLLPVAQGWVNLSTLAVDGVIENLELEYGRIYAITSGNVIIKSASFKDSPSKPYMQPFKVYFSLFTHSSSGASITIKNTSGSKLKPPLNVDFIMNANEYADTIVEFIQPYTGNDVLRKIK